MHEVAFVETAEAAEAGGGHVHQRAADGVHRHGACGFGLGVAVDADEGGVEGAQPCQAEEGRGGGAHGEAAAAATALFDTIRAKDLAADDRGFGSAGHGEFECGD